MGDRQKMEEKMLYIFNYVILAVCAFITLFPFLNVIAISFSSSRSILSGEVFLWPVEFTMQAYQKLIRDGQLIRALGNTVTITVIGTAINMAATILTAYSLSKKRLMGRSILMAFMVFTMLFGGGLIPTFIIVKNMGLVNSYASLWLPGMISVYNMIIMKTFFENIPESLEEAASIDGASDLYILLRIILPLSLPAIATLTLFYAVGWWNDYFNVMIYITSSNKLSMTVKLMQMINNISDSLLLIGDPLNQQDSMAPEGVKAAAIIITAVPILSVYPFLQKYFVKGVMIGSVKG